MVEAYLLSHILLVRVQCTIGAGITKQFTTKSGDELQKSGASRSLEGIVMRSHCASAQRLSTAEEPRVLSANDIRNTNFYTWTRNNFHCQLNISPT